jgi:hypothetical protein
VERWGILLGNTSLNVLQNLVRKCQRTCFIAITGQNDLKKCRRILPEDFNIRHWQDFLYHFLVRLLVGVDIEKVLINAEEEILNSKKSGSEIQQNISAKLGTIMGVLAGKGIDKITFIISPNFSFFGAWAEQLIAESTGKIGKGILPVDLESIESSEYYSNDRLFVYIKLKDDNTLDDKAAELKSTGHPMIEIQLDNIYELGGEFFRWVQSHYVLNIPSIPTKC